MGLTISDPWDLESHVYSPEVMADLFLAEEWEQLGYWMCVTWIRWLLDDSGITEEDVMSSLFHRRPSTTRKLKE